MRSIKKALAIFMALAVVISTITAFDITTASAKLKSIKVAKKVTVAVGQTKTVKVNVKTTGKTSKKFTVKASKKKIVKVTKKKGKIEIKGLKAGTVKLTIKSKANKKKKKTIKVTVKEAAVKDTDVKMTAKQVDSYIFTLTFSKAVNLSVSNLSAQIKKIKSGNYVHTVKIEDLSTTDNKVYTVVLSDNIYISDGCIIRFTVNGVNKKAIIQELETYFPDRERLSEKVYIVEDNQIIEKQWDIDDYTGSNSYGKVKSVSGIPAGLKYNSEDGTINLKGTIGKTGVFTINFVIEDEKGTSNTLRIVFVAGNEYELTVYCPKKTVGIYQNGLYSYKSFVRAYISGGSGSYTVKAYDTVGIFDGDPVKDDDGIYDWDFNTDTIGTKTGIFTVEDDNIPNLKKNCNAVVETKKTILINGKITSATGKPIEGAKVCAEPKQYGENQIDNYSYSDNNGDYKIEVLEGTYDVYSNINNVYSYVYDKKITSNVTINFKLNLYTVELKSNDTKLDPKSFKYWDDEDIGRIGEGRFLYLKPGTYNVKSSGDVFPAMKYDATAQFTVKGDMTVLAKVNVKELKKIIVEEGDYYIEVTEDENIYCMFTPKQTGIYNISSTNSTGDPDVEVFDEDVNLMEEDFSYGDFNVDVTMQQGKTYYIIYNECEGTGNSITLHIGKN